MWWDTPQSAMSSDTHTVGFAFRLLIALSVLLTGFAFAGSAAAATGEPADEAVDSAVATDFCVGSNPVETVKCNTIEDDCGAGELVNYVNGESDLKDVLICEM